MSPGSGFFTIMSPLKPIYLVPITTSCPDWLCGHITGDISDIAAARDETKITAGHLL